MSKASVADHERLFDEICGKLNELSPRSQSETSSNEKSDRLADRQPDLTKLHHQLRKSQEELKMARNELNEKINSISTAAFTQQDLSIELKKMSDQLEAERMNSSKISTDLAKSLELNLKLQFEIEEIRTRANHVVSEERKHNQFLIDKNKTLASELELAQALQHEARSELGKAKEKYLSEQTTWFNQRAEQEERIRDLKEQMDVMDLENDELKVKIKNGEREFDQLSQTLRDFEQHAIQQNSLMKQISEAAEQKMVELKMAFDRKSIECQDYYSHLQQALNQNQVFRQENAALKDYISKLSALHQARSTEASL